MIGKTKCEYPKPHMISAEIENIYGYDQCLLLMLERLLMGSNVTLPLESVSHN
jgi:hypothetical protein